jgi:predicted dehydrogenase
MDKTARIGVIGAGWWAVSNHIPLLVENSAAELVSVSRLGAAALQQVKDRFGFRYASERVEEMLDASPLDGVIVASPHYLHVEHAILALTRGAHVLVEKPVATRIEDALALKETAISVDRQVLTPLGWNFRSYAPVARNWIAGGEVGRIRHVSVQMASPAEDLFTGLGFSGAKQALFHPEATTWTNPERAGGYGWGQLPHLFGLLFYLAPELEPKEVCGRSVKGTTGTDLYDSMIVEFKNGALASISGSATVPSYARFQVDIRIFGETGMVLLDLERERVELWRNDGTRSAHPLFGGEGSYSCVEPIHCFVDLCTGKPIDNRGDIDIAVKCTRVLDGFYTSVESSKSVRVDGIAVSREFGAGRERSIAFDS